VAVIDVGTNSTRLLVADVEDGMVLPLERRSTVTRLGRGVDLSGRLSSEAIEDVCAAIGGYVGIFEELEAETVDAIATSAVRDADNGSAFVAELRERFALSARVLDGEEEARSTYIGATAEAPPTEPTLVVDIGGGSTELIVGQGSEIFFHDSLQAGVVRHSERHVSSDPPTAGELEALATDVRGLIESSLGAEGTRALRPGPGPRPRPGAAVDPAHALQPRLRPAGGAGRDPGVAPRPGADDRRRRRHPGRGDAGLRAGEDRRLRARHPLRHCNFRHPSKLLEVLAGQAVCVASA
jgi:hypothetical protein